MQVNIIHEVAVFGSFYAIAATAHICQEKWAKHCERAKAHARSLKIAAVASAVLTHPTTLETMHEFGVHIIIYSGYVLGH